jgi:hypothetical protein
MPVENNTQPQGHTRVPLADAVADMRLNPFVAMDCHYGPAKPSSGFVRVLSLVLGHHRCHMADDPNWMAARRGIGPATAGDRSAEAHSAACRYEDRRIDVAIVGCGMCCDTGSPEVR